MILIIIISSLNGIEEERPLRFDTTLSYLKTIKQGSLERLRPLDLRRPFPTIEHDLTSKILSQPLLSQKKLVVVKTGVQKEDLDVNYENFKENKEAVIKQINTQYSFRKIKSAR